MCATSLAAGSTYWRCTEFKVDSGRLFYSRFMVSPLEVGQANTLGVALRRTLLGELEGACFIFAVFPAEITHEYTAVAGVRESVHDILMNLKEIVLRGHSSVVREAYISIAGPGEVTARDVVLPPFVRAVDPTQYIATVTGKMNLNIELKIGKGRGYRGRNMVESQKGEFPLDAIFTPIRNVNYSIHCYENHSRGIMKEMLLLEIWTNGSITPREAVSEASRSLINLFSSFAYA
uniref:DNA-directed RNA polymerase n=1 Tax=Selaginella lyallii TaxID=137159 RepID=A0A481ZL90_9TRAC|nr:RNA polymerase alpha subunit [Selaginella lyallii]QBL02089.1 RNA polymerase alpha subunit [Selaginella lyallii]